MKKYLENCISQGNINVVDAMKKIQDNAKGILYIVDENGNLLGSVTDGDIRRWIISTGDITGNVSQFLNTAVKVIKLDQVDDSKRILNSFKVRSLPVLDSNGKIVDIIFDDYYANAGIEKCLNNVPIIIMAGGKGTRLYPYTKILPKPLIPIGDVPIIERIMNQFNQYGANHFYIIVNYKKEMIRSYFMDVKLPYDIDFVNEADPLGTAGGIRLIDDKFESPIIVTNCDIIIDAEYGDILNSHNKFGNDMTIVSSLKNFAIPYGVLEARENGRISSMREKPSIPAMINTGMYILNPEYVEWIPRNTFFHMTQLAQLMIDRNKRVGMYPINEIAFLDMGEFEEMKKMEKRIETLTRYIPD